MDLRQPLAFLFSVFRRRPLDVLAILIDANQVCLKVASNDQLVEIIILSQFFHHADAEFLRCCELRPVELSFQSEGGLEGEAGPVVLR